MDRTQWMRQRSRHRARRTLLRWLVAVAALGYTFHAGRLFAHADGVLPWWVHSVWGVGCACWYARMRRQHTVLDMADRLL